MNSGRTQPGSNSLLAPERTPFQKLTLYRWVLLSVSSSVASSIQSASYSLVPSTKELESNLQERLILCMTQITKRQRPRHFAADRILRTRNGLVTLSILVVLSLVVFFRLTKNGLSSTGSGESEEDIGVDFEQIIPRPGEVMPLSWKADRTLVTPNAYRVSIPPELFRAMKEYCDKNGLTELARHYILSEENNIRPGEQTAFRKIDSSYFSKNN